MPNKINLTDLNNLALLEKSDYFQQLLGIKIILTCSMFSKVHLRGSTQAFIYSVSSFPFLYMKNLIPSKYLSVKYTYILSLTALSFSGLKCLLMSLHFGFVCIFFPSRTCRVYRKHTLKAFQFTVQYFPHMHLFASDT